MQQQTACYSVHLSMEAIKLKSYCTCYRIPLHTKKQMGNKKGNKAPKVHKNEGNWNYEQPHYAEQEVHHILKHQIRCAKTPALGKFLSKKHLGSNIIWKSTCDPLTTNAHFKWCIRAYIWTKHWHCHIAKIILRCDGTQHCWLYPLFIHLDTTTIFQVFKCVLYQPKMTERKIFNGRFRIRKMVTLLRK